IPTTIFSLAATSFELRCQCPLVTPASLNGNGCEAAAPTARAVDASNKLANNVVFIKPSLLRRYSPPPYPPRLRGRVGWGRVYPKSALLMASGVVGFSHRFTPAKR